MELNHQLCKLTPTAWKEEVWRAENPVGRGGWQLPEMGVREALTPSIIAVSLSKTTSISMLTMWPLPPFSIIGRAAAPCMEIQLLPCLSCRWRCPSWRPPLASSHKGEGRTL